MNIRVPNQCTKCSRPLTWTEILQFADSCSVPLGVVYFRCAHCAARQQAKVEPNRISIGYIDGAPLRRFIAQSTELVPGLTVTETEAGLDCVRKDRTFKIPRYVFNSKDVTQRPMKLEGPETWWRYTRRRIKEWILHPHF